MKIHQVTIRAGYADSDQMGFVHHSNYVKYLEHARWEVFRELGSTYKSIEESGIHMPVIDMQLRFIKPIYYNDPVRIEVQMTLIGSTRLLFKYHFFEQWDHLIHKAETVLASTKKNTKKPCRVPECIRQMC